MIHKTADVSNKAKLGKDLKVWNNAQIREYAEVGDNSIISKNVYIDCNVKIGKNVKIQNNVSIYRGVVIEDGVFIGSHVCFTNDKLPRAINPDGKLKSLSDWKITKTLVKKGASIGSNSTILPGITIGNFAMIGAGSVIVKDIPDYGLAYGNPIELKGYVCRCGSILKTQEELSDKVCNACKIAQ